MKTRIVCAAIVVAALSLTSSLQSEVIDFEDLTFAVGDFENGSNLTGSESTLNNPFGPDSGSLINRTSTISSGTGPTASATNAYSRKFSGADGTGTFEFDSWSGWAYSKVNNTITAGFGNQYAAYTGTGLGGSGTYAVIFSGSNNFINLPTGWFAQSVHLTNTTYAALSMLNGDSIGKQFGGNGPVVDDQDFFDVILTGYAGLSATGSTTGSVTFRLADYTFADNSLDFIVNTWQSVDLTPLGSAQSIDFSWASSDIGMFGINTPTYVALDSLVLIPEPSTGILLVLSCSAMALLRRRRLATTTANG